MRPHGIRIEPIQIECGFSETTFRGGLNANWKWIEKAKHDCVVILHLTPLRQGCKERYLRHRFT